MNARTFFETVANTTEDTNVKEYAEAQIIKLDERNEKRRSKAKEMKPEDITNIEKIKSVLVEATTPVTTAEIKTLADLNITTQKITSLVKKIENVKTAPIKNATTKRFVNAYTIE